MGYFGLPSKACASCRSRRIKCDLALPSCGQCARIFRVCSGYRDPTQLLFRDQTDDVTRRVQRAKRPSQQKLVEAVSKSACSSSHIDREQMQLDIPHHFVAARPTSLFLPISLEHQAFCFFFSNYVSCPSKNFNTIYESIPALYLASTNDSALLYVITALGLAGLSCHTETSGMETAAGAWYNKALVKLNRTLQDPVLAKADLTLLVVLLLGLYETTTCRTSQSMTSWLRHAKGATALLELRGEEQLNTNLGRALFTQTRTHIIAGSVQTKTPLPELVIRLSRKYREATSNPLEDIIPLISHFCQIRSGRPFYPVRNQTESTTRTIISQYTTLSQQMQDWHDQLPSSFSPARKFPQKPSASMLSEYYHVYDDVWTAAVVNNCNTNHMLVNEALIIQLSYLQDHFARDAAELVELNESITRARSTVINLVDEVCASVPHLLQSNMAAAGVGLLWALYVSAQISPRAASVHASTRGWIMNRLENIGAELGVRQATTLAGFLREGVKLSQVLDGSAGQDEEDD